MLKTVYSTAWKGYLSKYGDRTNRKLRNGLLNAKQHPSFRTVNYSRVDRTITPESLKQANKRLASLGLPANPLFALLQAASYAKITGKGTDELFEATQAAATRISIKDLDMYLYYTIIGLKDQLSDSQKEGLLSLISSESTKGYVMRSIKQHQ